jgi:hypothetical protein
VSGPLDFEPPRADDRPGTDGRAEGAPGERRRAVSVPRPPGASRYGWFVGVVAVLLIAYMSVHTLASHHAGSRGPAAGAPLPPFAAPIATSQVGGDVNVARHAGDGRAGDVPACSIHRAGVLNVCDMARRGPVVLAFLATRAADCTGPLDAMQRLRNRFPGVQFAAVAIRGDRSGLRTLVRSRGWRFPVAYDHDGILATLYGVAVCPQITYAYAGGTVAGTTIGQLGEAELTRRVRSLVARSRERGWTPPAT